MAKIYYRWIDAGRMTIDEVPEVGVSRCASCWKRKHRARETCNQLATKMNCV